MASPGKKSFLLRIEPLLWNDIERLAAAELRSVNAQIEYLLRDALKRRVPSTRAEPTSQVSEKEEDWGEIPPIR